MPYKIDGNVEFEQLVLKEGWIGNGSHSNPYIIDGLTIEYYYGRILKVTNIAVADELASAAELVMNKKDNIPVAIVKGYKYSKGNGSGREIIRPSHEDLFH